MKECGELYVHHHGIMLKLKWYAGNLDMLLQVGQLIVIIV